MQKGGDQEVWGMIETTDIFRSAFFLCKGGRLAGLRIREDNHRTVTFTIEGEDIGRLNLDYYKGQALVNPVLLRETLNHLKDVMFMRLRESACAEAPADRDNPILEAERRLRDDRERENRGDQEEC
jgi:hypothetical protein